MEKTLHVVDLNPGNLFTIYVFSLISVSSFSGLLSYHLKDVTYEVKFVDMTWTELPNNLRCHISVWAHWYIQQTSMFGLGLLTFKLFMQTWVVQ